MRLSSFLATFTAGQKNTVVSHSNRHFHTTRVQFQHFNRHFNSHQHQGNTSKPSWRHRCPQAKSSNQLIRAKWPAKDSSSKPEGRQTFFLVVDDQQAGPSRLLTFTLTPMKHSTLHQLPQLQATKASTTYQDFQFSSETFNLG